MAARWQRCSAPELGRGDWPMVSGSSVVNELADGALVAHDRLQLASLDALVQVPASTCCLTTHS